MEKAFDQSKLKQIDNATKSVANQHYNLCLYRCDEKVNEFATHCKQACYRNILVPYHMVKHQAQDSEENLYRQCLADRMPNIKQTDYV